MAVNYVTIKGYVRDGKLEVELPENVTEGEILVQLPVSIDEQAHLLEDRPLFSEGAGPCVDDPYYLDSAVIIELMRTSIWDIALQIKCELAEE